MSLPACPGQISVALDLMAGWLAGLMAWPGQPFLRFSQGGIGDVNGDLWLGSYTSGIPNTYIRPP